MSWLEDAGVKVGSLVLGKDKINEILINKLVSRGRNRPHPWSTRCDHICWSGMTDRTYNGRLLPPFHCAGPEGQGAARPPLAAVTAPFAAGPGGPAGLPKIALPVPRVRAISDRRLHPDPDSQQPAVRRRRRGPAQNHLQP